MPILNHVLKILEGIFLKIVIYNPGSRKIKSLKCTVYASGLVLKLEKDRKVKEYLT